MKIFFVVLTKPLRAPSAVYIKEITPIGNEYFHEDQLTIFELKKLIWQQLNDDEGLANSITLWKVEGLIEGGEKWKTLEIIEDDIEIYIENELKGTKLSPATQFKAVFTSAPPGGTIPIIVQLPSYSKCLLIFYFSKKDNSAILFSI